MTDDPLYEHLRQQGWRRKLTAAEQIQLTAWLGAHPDALEDWETEKCLNATLARVTDVPVSSNFTSRVIQTIEHEHKIARRQTWSWPIWRPWATAAIALAIGVCLFSFQSLKNSRIERVRRSLVTFSEVSALSNPEVLTKFDVICALDRTPAPDEDLLKLLQ